MQNWGSPLTGDCGGPGYKFARCARPLGNITNATARGYVAREIADFVINTINAIMMEPRDRFRPECVPGYAAAITAGKPNDGIYIANRKAPSYPAISCMPLILEDYLIYRGLIIRYNPKSSSIWHQASTALRIAATQMSALDCLFSAARALYEIMSTPPFIEMAKANNLQPPIQITNEN